MLRRLAAEYLQEEVASLRKGIEKAEAPPKKKGAAPQAPPPKVRMQTLIFYIFSLTAGFVGSWYASTWATPPVVWPPLLTPRSGGPCHTVPGLHA